MLSAKPSNDARKALPSDDASQRRVVEITFFLEFQQIFLRVINGRFQAVEDCQGPPRILQHAIKVSPNC